MTSDPLLPGGKADAVDDLAAVKLLVAKGQAMQREIDARTARTEWRRRPDRRIDCLLTDGHAFALAQLCKRIGWVEVRANAMDESEAHLMIEAIERVRDALAVCGVVVR